MTFYRERKAAVEAVQVGDAAHLPYWCADAIEEKEGNRFIRTIDGNKSVQYGDWILRLAQGQFDRVPAALFHGRYEKVED